MAPSFGTSGLRGLVVELTPDLVARYVRAFLAVCPHGGQLFVGQDLRPSSPRIAADVIAAAQGCGIDVVDCGALPTPALAMAAMAQGAAAVMVTGSHIPADRNGLKFYVPSGEVSKTDEAKILEAYAAAATREGQGGGLKMGGGVPAQYVARYAQAFGDRALAGLKVGVYEHSSVAREAMVAVLRSLGAQVVRLARSDVFIPVDTEAVDPETRQMLQGWCAEHGLDALVSTDGDADRPMVTDAGGQIVPGDVLGVITARLLGAQAVCTPVSSNAMVSRIPAFRQVVLTRIGSPYVIAAMEEILAADPAAKVVGFEANGGFLLGFTAEVAGRLAPLLTRDSILPIVAPLVAAVRTGTGLAEVVAQLPPCFTAADRVQDINPDKARRFLAGLIEDEAQRQAFFAPSGAIDSLDLTDGLRVNLASGEVVHLRPSGNAPEFRIYAQAASAAAAGDLVQAYFTRVAAAVL